MNFCPSCGNRLTENAAFCSHCGTAVTMEPPQISAEKKTNLMHHLRRNLRHERVVWKGFGIFYAVFSGYWIFLSLFFLVFGFSDVLFAPLGILGTIYLMVGILFCAPIAVIHFIMVHKLTEYIDRLETDCHPAVERAGSVGTIVFAALFNTVALIFVILNFVHVKTNAEAFKTI